MHLKSTYFILGRNCDELSSEALPYAFFFRYAIALDVQGVGVERGLPVFSIFASLQRLTEICRMVSRSTIYYSITRVRAAVGLLDRT